MTCIHIYDNSELNKLYDSNLDNEPRLGLLHPVVDDARTVRIEPFKCPDGRTEVALLEVILRSCKPRADAHVVTLCYLSVTIPHDRTVFTVMFTVITSSLELRLIISQFIVRTRTRTHKCTRTYLASAPFPFTSPLSGIVNPAMTDPSACPT